LIGTLLTIQIILGIITVLILDGKISVFWGTSHQIVGLTLFLSVWWFWLKQRRMNSTSKI
jgi:heme A synthase